MDRQHIIEIISRKLKLVRVEAGYTQDKMAEILGVSKKTLVQIEKGRITAGWTTIICVCALFRDSEIIQLTLGEDPLEVLETVAHDGFIRRKEKTMGGKVWWRDLEKNSIYTLQQNLISKHYRIIDGDNYRYFSTFDKKEAYERYQEFSSS
jgi:DNA-binding XRE family transcriptional regulator